MLGVMFRCGRSISNKSGYWRHAAWCIIAFVFVEGMRYNRGVDYLHYIDVYKYDLEDGQILFAWINRTLKFLGIAAIYAFLFYAIPFIICGVRLMKEMKRYALYMFPLFLISIISFHETFVRQALAMSFVFLYVVQLNNIFKKRSSPSLPRNKLSDLSRLLLYAALAIFIHSVSLLTIAVITVVFVFFRRPFPWVVTIPLLLIGKYYVATNFNWSLINSLLSIAAYDEKLSGYLDKTDLFFSENAINDKYARNLIISILETISNIVLLYLGNKICKIFFNVDQETFVKNKNSLAKNGESYIYVVLYNVTVIGMLLFLTFFKLELFRRIAFSWYLFSFVPWSVILYHRNDKNIFNRCDKILIWMFVCWLWDYVRFLFVFEIEPQFIWDI